MRKIQKRRCEMNDNRSTGGISFIGLLTILFIGLKLTGYIHWSWFWVLSPMLIPIGIAVIVLLACKIITKLL